MSFKKIALYNFIFMAICLIITAVIVFLKYSTAQIKRIAQLLLPLLLRIVLSNINVLAGVYIAKVETIAIFASIGGPSIICGWLCHRLLFGKNNW